MAEQPASTDSADVDIDSGINPFAALQDVLKPLSSLKLTVALFACSIILVMAGTLAQADLDIWDVVRDYFRCWFAWMPARVWYPLFARIEQFEPIKDALEQADPRIGIWFPGGYLLGALMAVNLLSAHLLKFRIQASGNRLAAGIVVTAIGCVATWMVIASGDGTGLQQTSDVFYDRLWTILKVLLGVLLVFNVGGAASAVRRGKSESPLLILSALALAGVVYWVLFEMDTRFNSSSMRILWQLVKAEMAALILLGGGYLLFKKRAGVTLLHAGIALVMINEVVVDSLHIETQMAIEEGHTVNFAKDIREIEFAVIDRSSPDFDEEVVIRRDAVLAAGRAAADREDGAVISDPELPFDIEVLEYMQNSNPEDARPGAENRATAGSGLQLISISAKPTTGTDSSGRVDLTAAYVRLIRKDTQADLGTYLTGVVFEMLGKNEFQPNRVTVDGKDYDIALRFRRYYKPYSVHLSDVSKTDYIGTNTPMDYRSIVDVIDAESGDVLVDNRHIWMNNPMRYSGDTFYQSSYAPPNPRTGEKETTTLSVVSNTGWMIPYMSCMIVGTGMLAHFFAILLRFLNRRARMGASAMSRTLVAVMFSASFGVLPGILALFFGEALAKKADEIARAEREKRSAGKGHWAIPIIVAVLMGGWLLSKARVPSAKDGEPDLPAFGRLPVVYEGRVKPLDTVARNSLRALSNREEMRNADGEKEPAIKWLLDVISGDDSVRDHAVFRIDHPQVLQKLKLSKRERHLYSINDIAENVAELAQDAAMARQKGSDQHTPYEKAVLGLERKIGEFDLLASAFSPPEIRQDNIQQVLAMLQSLSQRSPPLAIPPTRPEDGAENDGMETAEWETVAHASVRSMVAVMMGREENKQLRLYADILDAHLNDDTAAFNQGVKEYQNWLDEHGDWLQSQLPPRQLLSRTSFESFYNHFSPFYYSAFSYLFAFVLTAVGLLGWSKPLNRAAFLVILVTLVVHTFALGARIYISGRPPVTNLYSSAVFIGWGCVIAGLIFEGLYRIGIGNLIASALGAASLGISHLLSGDGDTFAVLQAVLDTQFWLATHVVLITLGYSATFLAGHLGIVQVLGNVVTPWMTKQRQQDLTRMIYGTVCFGMFFSFVGTVLGGLWADDSWGRFWGWDPKENGALLIVIWNALLLHARWDRMVLDRGFATLAIAGNIVTSWSWFGVNELGLGLHSYGFTDGVWLALWCYWGSQVALIAAGLIPWRKPVETEATV